LAKVQPLLPRGRDGGWRAFRVVPHILLEWFVAQHKTESALRVCIHGRVQKQGVAKNHGLLPLRPILLIHREVKLVIDEPVVGHVQNRSILQEELR
jgi:hypothetical protein